MNDKDFSEQYRESCFYAWYRAGSPLLMNLENLPTVGGRQLMKSLPPDETGKKPSYTTVQNWMYRFDWQPRAEALDAQVSLKLDKEVVNERVRILRELAKNGETLKQKGLDYLNNNDDPFADNPNAAVRAIVAGSEMQFKYAGQADVLANIAQMSDKQIEREVLRLLGKETDEDSVDATEDDNSIGE